MIATLPLGVRPLPLHTGMKALRPVNAVYEWSLTDDLLNISASLVHA